jgi:hypothetical protein
MDYLSGDGAPSPRTIHGATCERLPDGAQRTVIEDIHGSGVEIEHGPEVDVLCLGRDRVVIPIPDPRGT